RALDWGQDVDGAVQAGAKAVAAKPATAVAHVFYSEALADSGQFTAAQRELRAAEDMGGDAYVQAEIDREWANYYRSHGDSQSELNYTELAVKAQPRFPERQLDLIRFDYGNQRPDAARTLSDKLLAGHTRSYPLLVAAADAALVGGDGDRAPSLYRAAAGVKPDGAEAAIGLAEVAVALQRDFTGAHDTLLAALRGNPTSSAIYEFLRELDLLVLKKDPAAELDPIAAQRPTQLAADRKAALDAANGPRATLGLPPLREDPALDDAAQAHAYYYLFNASQQQVGGTGVTAEDASLPGFTGARSIDRARHFGFGGARGVELANHVLTAGAAVQSSVDSVFHRLPLLDREVVAAGFGAARVGPLAIAVLDVGAGQPGTGDPVVYPADGQAGVQPAFTDNEVPDPLPQGTVTPTGYPVTLEIGGAQQLNVASGRLLDAGGKEVPSITLAPGNQLGASQWALIPKQPLAPGGRYTVEVGGTIDGKDFSKRWSFTVAEA
ncbi:MAG TPA: CAP domain-containing protein, partial [Candidatus Dormibacteraeota bacterium]|nr:CAP domain-containing protein [Candidatus Dormibacteraeota bacterium]